MPRIQDLFVTDTQDVTVERHSRIATIVLNKPDEMNRITPAGLAKLHQLTEGFARDTETQAIVITGAGSEYFSMGLLNPVLRASFSKDDIMTLVRFANRVFSAIEALPQIVIAALNGVTRAGGAELSLACDIRLAAEHATLTFPEAAWGGFPGAGGPVRLAHLLGQARALELICTARDVGAVEMERIGLVQGVLPSEKLLGTAQALAEQIASSGPLATRGAKRIMRATAERGQAAGHDLADALRHALEWSADVDEGIAAHKEGRAPKFTGR
jgi:enoyl-CoA hydratase